MKHSSVLYFSFYFSRYFARLFSGLSLILICCIFTQLSAQEDHPYLGKEPFRSPKNKKEHSIQHPNEIRSDKTSEGTDTLTVNLPFFDSFTNIKFNIRSNSNRPDTALWLKRTNVTLTRNQAINPADFGTATFDGMKINGFPHSSARIANTGPADTLMSHFINLKGLKAEDNVFLSFRVQPGGHYGLPRPQSSFRLILRDNNNRYTEPQNAIFRNGTFNDSDWKADQFYTIHFQLDPSFYHEKFQLIFVNTSNLTNFGDVWHLDYVYLDKNRSREDTIPRDVGFQSVNMRRFWPYSACPLVLRRDTALFSVPTDTAFINNLNNIPQRFNLSYEIRDSMRAGVSLLRYELSPDVLQTGPLVQTYVQGNLDASGKFTYQASDPKKPRPTEPRTLRMNWGISSADFNSKNNHITVEYPTDSILAFDDGELENSIGHNNPRRAFGMKFHWRKSDTFYTRRVGRRVNTFRYKQPDSVRAIWLGFYPRHEFVDTFLTFRLGFWKDTLAEVSPLYLNREDTFCVHEACNFCVNFGTVNRDNCKPKGPFHFYRYPIFPPFPIQDTSLIIGLVQNQAFRDVGFGVLVGRDVNTPNRGVYYQFQSEWRDMNEYNGRNIGTPAIRLEISNGTSVWNSRPDEQIKSFSGEVFPNPASGGSFYVKVKSPFSSEASVLTLLDMTGREVFRENKVLTDSETIWQVNYGQNALPEGVYFLKLQSESGKVLPWVRKVMID